MEIVSACLSTTRHGATLRVGAEGRPAFARTWYEQAVADLNAAELSAGGGSFEWACFQCQQSGEKALEAFLYSRGMTAVLTHSLRKLVRERTDLPVEPVVVSRPVLGRHLSEGHPFFTRILQGAIRLD